MTPASTAPDLFRYQHNIMGLLFARDPEPFLVDLGGNTDRFRVYRRMARRRLRDTIHNSFPRLVAILSDRFDPILERFFEQAPPKSPYIRDVPGEFAHFLGRSDVLQTESARLPPSPLLPSLPPWVAELARYEWALLDTAYIAEEEGAQAVRVGELSMDFPAVLTPAHRLLRLHWSVHRLTADIDRSAVVEAGRGAHQAREDFALCLYRDPDSHEVRALELTPLAASLLEEVARSEALAREVARNQSDSTAPRGTPLVSVVRKVAEMHHATIDEAFVTALSDLIADLVERGVWLGSLRDCPDAHRPGFTGA
ncbi:MAG: hypothetical protein NVS3B20_21060 [Polyangiales bacterium]